MSHIFNEWLAVDNIFSPFLMNFQIIIFVLVTHIGLKICHKNFSFIRANKKGDKILMNGIKMSKYCYYHFCANINRNV